MSAFDFGYDELAVALSYALLIGAPAAAPVAKKDAGKKGKNAGCEPFDRKTFRFLCAKTMREYLRDDIKE